MKKLLALTLSLAFCVALLTSMTGCPGGDKTTTKTTTTGATTTTTKTTTTP